MLRVVRDRITMSTPKVMVTTYLALQVISQIITHLSNCLLEDVLFDTRKP